MVTKFLVLSIAIAAVLTIITTSTSGTADAKGQCRDTDEGISCSGGIGTPPGGRGIHEEFGFDGSQTIAGGFGQPGSNEEGVNNGRHCDSSTQRCVGEGFNSGQ